MCFAPQRRALFRQLNFQKSSDIGVLCTFWLGNVLRATTACIFSTSQLPKMVWEWCVLYILTWKCASRHNGGQFFISQLASWLRTRRFSEAIPFDPPEPQIIGKTQWIATFLPFRGPASSFFWLFLFSDLLTSWLLLSGSSHLCFFHLSILSEVVGSLTSKLPSIMYCTPSLYLTCNRMMCWVSDFCGASWCFDVWFMAPPWAFSPRVRRNQVTLLCKMDAWLRQGRDVEG